MKLNFRPGSREKRFVASALHFLKIDHPRKFRKIWRRALEKYPDIGSSEQAIIQYLLDRVIPHLSHGWTKVGSLSYVKENFTLSGRYGRRDESFGWELSGRVSPDFTPYEIALFYTKDGNFPARKLSYYILSRKRGLSYGSGYQDEIKVD